MRKCRFLVLCLVLAFVMTGEAGAQPGDDFPLNQCLDLFARQEGGAGPKPIPKLAPELAGRKLTRQDRRAPGGLGALAPKLQSSVDLTAGEVNGRGTLTYAGTLQSPAGPSSKWAASVNVPFDKTKQEGSFLSLTGLSGDIVASVERSWFVWDLQPRAFGERLCHLCADEGLSLLECSIAGLQAHWSKPPEPPEIDFAAIDEQVVKKAEAFRQALGESCSEVEGAKPVLDCGLAGLMQVWREELVVAARKAAAASVEPDAEAVREAQERALALQDMLFGGAAAKFWGFEVSAGTKDRNYFDLDGTKKDEDRIGYKAALIGGVSFTNGTLYARVIGKRDFKENSKVSKCEAIEGSELEKCEEQPLGEAKEIDSLIAAVEWRRFFPKLAISPAVAYDFEIDEWTAQLPVFLFRDKDEAFTGGVKLLWGSEDNDLSAAVFVTKAFNP